jgi:predicted nucleic acid-binding protein
MNKVFIDSNLWLYAFIEGQDADKHTKANHFLQTCQDTIVISNQVISEVSANLLRKAKIEESSLQAIIKAFYEKYEVVALHKANFLSASDIRVRYRLSYWDSLIMAVALQEGCTALYSEDLNNQQKIENLTIINPFV